MQFKSHSTFKVEHVSGKMACHKYFIQVIHSGGEVEKIYYMRWDFSIMTLNLFLINTFCRALSLQSCQKGWKIFVSIFHFPRRALGWQSMTLKRRSWWCCSFRECASTVLKILMTQMNFPMNISSWSPPPQKWKIFIFLCVRATTWKIALTMMMSRW